MLWGSFGALKDVCWTCRTRDIEVKLKAKSWFYWIYRHIRCIEIAIFWWIVLMLAEGYSIQCNSFKSQGGHLTHGSICLGPLRSPEPLIDCKIANMALKVTGSSLHRSQFFAGVNQKWFQDVKVNIVVWVGDTSYLSLNAFFSRSGQQLLQGSLIVGILKNMTIIYQIHLP